MSKKQILIFLFKYILLSLVVTFLFLNGNISAQNHVDAFRKFDQGKISQIEPNSLTDDPFPPLKFPWEQGEKRWSTGLHGGIAGGYCTDQGTSQLFAVDIAGEFEVLAPADGYVEDASNVTGCGSSGLRIRHNSTWKTEYCHLASRSVDIGQFVYQGEVIGVSGTDGCGSCGTHLHWSIIRNGGYDTWDDKIVDGWRFHGIVPGSGVGAPLYGMGTATFEGTSWNRYLADLSDPSCNPNPLRVNAWLGSVSTTRVSNISITGKESPYNNLVYTNPWLPSTNSIQGSGCCGCSTAFANTNANTLLNRTFGPLETNWEFPQSGNIVQNHSNNTDNWSESSMVGQLLNDGEPLKFTRLDIRFFDWGNEPPPVFEWSQWYSVNSEVSGFLIYWGEDEGGQGELFVTEARFRPELPLLDNIATSYYLRVAPVDGAGNAGEWQTTAVWQYDSAAPTGSLAVSGGADVVKTLHPELMLTAADQGSGVAEMRLSVDGENWNAWQDYKERFQWELAEGMEEQYVYAQLRDFAGNESAVLETTVRADLNVEPPTSTSYQIDRSVMVMGGGNKNSTSYQMHSTTGQAQDNTLMQGDNFQIYSGFWLPNLGPLQIALPQGWNLISSFVEPQDPRIEVIFSGIENHLVLVKNGKGEIFWPDFGVNQIGNWNIKEGYLVYLSSPTLLSINGTKILPENYPIVMPQGWSQIAYLRDSPMPIETALATVHTNIVVVKNSAGAVYWPGLKIDDIGDMQPKQGYQLYLDQAGILVYPGN